MKKVVTEKDVDALVSDGTLHLTRDMVLTPGAREYATRKGLEFRWGERTRRPAEPPVDDSQLASIIEQIVVEEISRKAGASGTPAAPAPPPVPERAAHDPLVDPTLDAECKSAVLSYSDDEDSNRAIVTVVGHNRPGIVARISAVVADCGGDLADVSQVILDRYFSMIFIVNLSGLEAQGLSFRVFKEKLHNEAAALGRVQILVMHEDIFKAMHKV